MNQKKDPNFSLKQIHLLRDEIKMHDNAYYVNDNPTISDEEYDNLVDKLHLLEKKFPEAFDSSSPTQCIGGKASDKFTPIIHSIPMLSLNSGCDENSLLAFNRRITIALGKNNVQYICELKFDGIAVSLNYENGKLQYGATRGDGLIGENITSNIEHTICNIPLKLKSQAPTVLEVRGEALMLKSDFEKLNEYQLANNGRQFSNARNAAAGTLRQIYPNLIRRKLYFFAYGVGVLIGQNLPISHCKLLDWYHELGLPINNKRCVVLGINGVINFFNTIYKYRSTLPYHIDGIVCKVNRYDEQTLLGFISRAPRFAFAYKFPPQTAITKIKKIDITVGRTGIITPVAQLEPVIINSVRITSATLHNENVIVRKNICIGDNVIIQRAGDVIPKIIATLPKKTSNNTTPFKIPDYCPICNSVIERSNYGLLLRCTGNLICVAQRKQALLHFAQKSAFNIKGLGIKIIDQLVEKKLVILPSDLFYLNKTTLLHLSNFAEKSAINLCNAIENAKTISFARLIFALGIHHVGESTAKNLACHFDNIDSFVKASFTQLVKINDIGPIIAMSITTFFRQQHNIKLIQQLHNAGIKIIDNDKNHIQNKSINFTSYSKLKNILDGKNVVFTGKLLNFPRNISQTLMRSVGAKICNSVSKKTDYLIAGKKTGNKFKKAVDLGIKILDEADILLLIDN